MKNQKSTNSPEVILKEITKEDLLKVAKVHINSFPESALTQLGTEIIQRYYLWQLIGPHEKVRAVGAFLDEDCAGFCFSGVFNGSISGFIDYNKSFLIKEVLTHPWLLTNPLFRERLYSGVKLLKNFMKKEQSSKPAVKEDEPESYGILSIAVSTNHQKMGVGKILMLDAENEAVKCGYQRMHLSVNPDNKQATRFYENLNWQKSTQDNLWKGFMIKPLN